MAERKEIYLGGCDIEWPNPTIRSTGVALDGDDAVKFSVYESNIAVDPTDLSNGDVVVGADAVTMTFIDNKFTGPLPATSALVRGAFYWLETTATPDGGSPHTRRSLVQAVDRGNNP